ncbi:MAG: hypothetical protein LBE51_13590 [Acidovorax sp.]|jgi:hypothetical protein|nr:hypothetical protein [Acidovorax sp.]
MILAFLLLAAGFAVRTYKLGQMRAPVLKTLDNPIDVQFRNESHAGSWFYPEGVLCGEVSSRDLLSGRTDFLAFAALDDTAKIEGYLGYDRDSLNKICNPS